MKLRTHTLVARPLLLTLAWLAAWNACADTTEAYPSDSICYNYAVTPPPEPTLIVPKCRVLKDVMYFDGKIDEYLLPELKAAPGIRRLELNSYGGKLEAAFELAAYIRAQGLETHVRKGAKCGSACTLLYMAGTSRSAHPSVRLLFHGVRTFAGDFDVTFREMCEEQGFQKCGEWLSEQSRSFYDSTVALFERYIELGASPQLWEKYRNFEEDPDWFKDANFFKKKNWIMSAGEARELGVVQTLTDEE